MQMYISCNSVNNTYCIVDEIPTKDVAAWTLQLTGFFKKEWQIDKDNQTFEQDVAGERDFAGF